MEQEASIQSDSQPLEGLVKTIQGTTMDTRPQPEHYVVPPADM